MNDAFDEKRGMVKKLLDMLKAHASSEVSSGLSKPEGEDDMHGLQVEKVEVLPGHEMDKSTPEHEVDTKLIPEGQHTANLGFNQGGMAYNKGGVVEKVNATDPTPKIHSGPIPYESADGQPDKEGAVHKEVGEGLQKRDSLTTTEHEEPLGTEYPEAESEPSSMFASFLGRKKKK
jgi:hypothetical protein